MQLAVLLVHSRSGYRKDKTLVASWSQDLKSKFHKLQINVLKYSYPSYLDNDGPTIFFFVSDI